MAGLGKIKNTSNFHVTAYSYAMFWWGLFAIYCIGYQLSRLRVYWIRRQRALGKDVPYTPLPGARFLRPLNRQVKIPFVTDMIPVKHILGVTFFIFINIIFLFFAPFALNEGMSYEVPQIGIMDRRAAYLGMVNWCFVFLLGSRNTIITNMSGMTFEGFIPFHRWLARIGFLEFIPHFVWRMIHGYQKYHVPKDALFRDLEYTSGTVAMLGFMLIFVTAFEYIRRNYFEVFYYAHLTGILIAIIASCIHEVGCFLYFMPVVGLWFFDRMWRSYQSWAVKIAPLRIDEAVSQTKDQDGIVRILFQHSAFARFRPGQYVFIAIAEKGRAIARYANWHPMTVSEVFRLNKSAPNPLDNAIEERVVDNTAKEKIEKQVQDHDSLFESDRRSITSTLRRRAPGAAGADSNTIASLHVKALGNYTRRLLEVAASDDTLGLKVDGPYGPKLEYQDYPVMVAFATGIGITPALTLIKDCVERRTAGVKTVATESLYLIWVIRYTDELAPFTDLIDYWLERCQEAAQPLNLHLSIYVTRVQNGDENLIPGCKLHYGQRPDIHKCMASIHDAHPNTRAWVHTCGPDDFMRTVLNSALSYHWDAHHETFDL